MQQHEADLQQHLQLLRDAVGLALGEAFGAVARLQQERLATLGRGEPLAQRVDLPRHDDGRQPRDLCNGGL